MPKKKVKPEEVLTEGMSRVLESMNDSIRDVKKAAGKTPTEMQLEELAKQYETAVIKIYRKPRNSNKLQLFTQLEYPLSEFIEKGPDTLCKELGGGGEYKVKVQIRGESQARYEIPDISIAGYPFEVPANEATQDSLPSDMSKLNGPLPFGMGNFGGMGWGGSSQRKGGDDTVKQLTKQHESSMNMMQSSTDRMLALMMQSQQQMTTMLATMFQGRQNSQGEQQSTSEIAALKTKLEKMEEQTRAREELARRDREIAELKQAIQMQQNQAPKKSETEWLVPLFTQQNQSAQQSQSMMIELMKMGQNKPHESEMMSNLYATFSNIMQSNFEGQAQLLRVMKELSAEGEPGIKDFLMRGIDSLTELGQTALSRSTRVEPEYGAQQTEAAPAPMMGGEQPELFDGASPIAGLPAHEVEEQVPEPMEQIERMQEEEEDVELLTEEELAQLMRDSALQRAIASVCNGDHPSEATVRIYRHARSGNRIAQKWLAWPKAIGDQVFEHIEMEEINSKDADGKVVQINISSLLAQDIEAFFVKLSEDRSQERKLEKTWAKTAYNPEHSVEVSQENAGDVKEKKENEEDEQPESIQEVAQEKAS